MSLLCPTPTPRGRFRSSNTGDVCQICGKRAWQHSTAGSEWRRGILDSITAVKARRDAVGGEASVHHAVLSGVVVVLETMLEQGEKR